MIALWQNYSIVSKSTLPCERNTDWHEGGFPLSRKFYVRMDVHWAGFTNVNKIRSDVWTACLKRKKLSAVQLFTFTHAANTSLLILFTYVEPASYACKIYATVEIHLIAPRRRLEGCLHGRKKILALGRSEKAEKLFVCALRAEISAEVVTKWGKKRRIALSSWTPGCRHVCSVCPQH